MTFLTSSAEETIALGKSLSRVLQAGDVLVLSGDLGAGKTQFTKGLAKGLGVVDEITSPTFAIQMVYDGQVPLHHFDLYRIEDAAELEDTGIFDVLGEDGVCVIEWGDRFLDELGDGYLLVRFSKRVEAEREVAFEAIGERAGAVLEAFGEQIHSSATS